MTKEKIDINKTYRTRQGDEVRILCVDANLRLGDQEVVGVINGILFTWNAYGNISGSYPVHPRDLVEYIPPTEVSLELGDYLVTCLVDAEGKPDVDSFKIVSK